MGERVNLEDLIGLVLDIVAGSIAVILFAAVIFVGFAAFLNVLDFFRDDDNGLE